MNFNIDTNAQMLIIGDIMLDHYIYGNCNRISPEAPVPVVEIAHESYTLGGAGNVLKNLDAFNCQAAIISVVGDDSYAVKVADELAALGADSKGLIKDAQRSTTVKTRVLAANHQMIRLDREHTGPVNEQVMAQCKSLIDAYMHNCGVLLLSDYNKGLLTAGLIAEIVARCKNAGMKTLVDPKGIDFSVYKGVNIIKPNRKEASLATGIIIKDNDSLQLACAKIKAITACEAVVVTLSEDGIAIYEHDVLHIIPTRAIDVVDVTGAGDTVLAAIGAALASGYTLMEACDFANQAAAIVVSKVGSATATLNEINKVFKG